MELFELAAKALAWGGIALAAGALLRGRFGGRSTAVFVLLGAGGVAILVANAHLAGPMAALRLSAGYLVVVASSLGTAVLIGGRRAPEQPAAEGGRPSASWLPAGLLTSAMAVSPRRRRRD